ncbi:uncharacterized protein RCC_04280 [Ramularia collo-cygni]|uniref:NTF2 domain-containing protein n=1 Tax=Ramularia collo-cygni TaxID=112498 RepID=A0A2D3UW42_9PEZI|nr:uncharacterized protein RCC_04280 [Ramularia collo-cygni]CZT18435.1 uncharacterized protein RCC_04280 [Ramularia collo-cygni]
MADHTPASEKPSHVLSDTDRTRISANVAQTFLETYHDALLSNRSTLASFYHPTIPSPTPNRTIPLISYNGTLLHSGEDFQNAYESMPYTYHEVQSMNASIINPCLDPGKSRTKGEAERNCSVAVQVSGFVRLNERKEGEMRGFAESFVLVPSSEEVRGRAGAGRGRDWVAVSQCFRWVV